MGWFRKKVEGMPDFGQGSGWTRSQFTSRDEVPVDELVSTNRGGYLDERRARRYAKSAGKDGDVYVVEHKGRYYVADGHHHAAAAAMRGDSTVKVRVKRVR